MINKTKYLINNIILNIMSNIPQVNEDDIFLEEFSSKIKLLKSEIDKKITNNTTFLTNVITPKLKSIRQTIQPLINNIKKMHENIIELQKQIKKNISVESGCVVKLNELNAQYTKIQDELNECNKLKQEYESKISIFETEISQLNEHKSSCITSEQCEKDKNELNTQYTENLNNEKKIINEKENEIDELKQQINECNVKHTTLNEEKSNVNSSIEQIQLKLNNTQELNEKYKKAILIAQQSILDIITSVDSLNPTNDNVDEVNKIFSDISIKLNEINELTTDTNPPANSTPPTNPSKTPSLVNPPNPPANSTPPTNPSKTPSLVNPPNPSNNLFDKQITKIKIATTNSPDNIIYTDLSYDDIIKRLNTKINDPNEKYKNAFDKLTNITESTTKQEVQQITKLFYVHGNTITLKTSIKGGKKKLTKKIIIKYKLKPQKNKSKTQKRTINNKIKNKVNKLKTTKKYKYKTQVRRHKNTTKKNKKGGFIYPIASYKKHKSNKK
jgi:hypothetical protein